MAGVSWAITLASTAVLVSGCDAILGAHFDDAHLTSGNSGATSGGGSGAAGSGGGSSGASSGTSGGGACSVTAGSPDDPKNCGAPCHDCLGGACVQGVCQPVALASGQEFPYWLDVDGTDVYWTTLDFKVKSIPIEGGTETVVITESGSVPPTYVALTAEGVYWTLPGSGLIRGRAKGGGTPMDVWSGEMNAALLVATSARLFWYSGDTVRAGTPDGSAPITIASTTSQVLSSLRVYGSGVYWTDFYGGGILQADVGAQDASTTVEIYNDPAKSIRDVALDGAAVFWPHDVTPDIERGDLSGDSVTNAMTLGQLPQPAATLVAGGGGLYAVSSLGMVYAIDETSGNFGPLAAGPAVALRVTSCCVFWLSRGMAGHADGAVMKLAR